MNIPTDGRPEYEIDASEVLIGVDGNAFAVMGATKRALKQAKASGEYIQAYLDEAMSGDYDNLLSASVKFLEPDRYEQVT